MCTTKSKEDAEASASQQFIIMPAETASPEAVSTALSQHPSVDVLDSLDDSTVLVEMTEAERRKLAHAHPELTIEPNIRYQHF